MYILLTVFIVNSMMHTADIKYGILRYDTLAECEVAQEKLALGFNFGPQDTPDITAYDAIYVNRKCVTESEMLHTSQE